MKALYNVKAGRYLVFLLVLATIAVGSLQVHAEATDILGKNRLAGEVIGEERSVYYNAGTIIEQSPYRGEYVDPQTIVQLVASAGPEKDENTVKDAGPFRAELDCGDSLELAPPGMGKSCNIIVRGWRNTSDRVEVRVEYDKSSGITVFPGDTSAPPSLMYTAGVVESADSATRYIFPENFGVRENAPETITPVILTVSQQGAGEVRLSLDIAVLAKGQRPSTGPGIRPPATGHVGAGGEYCVWRHQIIYYPPNCFEFAKAPCTSKNYNSPYWELEGSNMSWDEAEGLVTRLSRYGGNAYGCSPSGDNSGDKQPADGGRPPDEDDSSKGCRDDRDCDGVPDYQDWCPDDAEKSEPGECGCGKNETGDTDGDGVHDCNDECPNDPAKQDPGECGCGKPDSDSDNNGIWDCKEKADDSAACPPNSHEADGVCVCDKGFEPFNGTCLSVCGRDESRDRNGNCVYDPRKEFDGGSPECTPEKGCPEGDEVCVNYKCIPRDDYEKGMQIVKGIRDEQDETVKQQGAGATGGGTPVSVDDYGTPPRPSKRDKKDRDSDKDPKDSKTPPDQDGTGGLSSVTVDTQKVTITFWDHGTEDGDIINIYVNGRQLRAGVLLTKAKQSIQISLNGGKNLFEVEAVNEGDVSPNTASVHISNVIAGSDTQISSRRNGQKASMNLHAP